MVKIVSGLIAIFALIASFIYGYNVLIFINGSSGLWTLFWIAYILTLLSLIGAAIEKE